MFSSDQSYRGIGAVIEYRGHALCRMKGLRSFKGAKWVVYSGDPTQPGSEVVGVARDFKAAKAVVDGN